MAQLKRWWREGKCEEVRERERDIFSTPCSDGICLIFLTAQAAWPGLRSKQVLNTAHRWAVRWRRIHMLRRTDVQTDVPVGTAQQTQHTEKCIHWRRNLSNVQNKQSCFSTMISPCSRTSLLIHGLEIKRWNQGFGLVCIIIHTYRYIAINSKIDRE